MPSELTSTATRRLRVLIEAERVVRRATHEIAAKVAEDLPAYAHRSHEQVLRFEIRRRALGALQQHGEQRRREIAAMRRRAIFEQLRRRPSIAPRPVRPLAATRSRERRVVRRSGGSRGSPGRRSDDDSEPDLGRRAAA